MSKLHHFTFVLYCTAVSLLADVEIALSGAVNDETGVAIAGAVVSLTSNSALKTTTTAHGEFTITNNTAISSKRDRCLSSSIGLTKNQLRYTIITPVNNGTVSIYSANGKMHLQLPLGKMESGLHLYTLPQMTPGCYLIYSTLDRTTTGSRLLCTGNGMFLSTNGVTTTNSKRSAAVDLVDTIIVGKDGFKPLKEIILSYKQSGIAIIMDRTKSPAIVVKDLPVIKEMPDPLTMNDGTKVTTAEQWKLRRREMIRILETYEYGHMPPSPGNVKAKVATPLTRVTASGKQADYRMMRLSFGTGDKLGFDLGIFTPVDSSTTAKRYPVLISLDFGASKTSLGAASAALSRGYAVATIPYQQLGADATNYRTTAFFPSYPEYDWRDFSAWAWGISRAVDYLVTDSLIDKEKIMITGVSRNAQAVLLAGAFDERIALSAPVAGGMALRFSGKEMGEGRGQGITEVVDQNTYWFGPLFEKFRNQTPRLPCDQHWLPALTAPRLFIMCNSLKDEYGRAYAAVQTYVGAKPVYQFLKAEENLGLNFRTGGHGMNAEDWSALLDFADQRLLKKAGTRKFDVIPPAEQIP